MSTAQATRESGRSTRQSTTRASIQAHPATELKDVIINPSPERQSRRRSTSPISSLSPSPQKITLGLPTPISTSSSPTTIVAPVPTRVRRDKGKGKAIEPPVPGSGQGEPSSRPGKRVLPARIRRAAGGGQEGFRDLEDMIVDWLDRYGYPSDLPPDDLRITITSLPLELVDPPVVSEEKAALTEQITVTPQEAGPSSRRDIIETPDWIKVTSGQDDEEEAREELLISRNPISPLRRLRRLSASHEQAEDVSDEHYHRLHKRYEGIEKRQRKDERDKLTHERYRMKTRIDLLKSISSGSWSSVVWTVLAREDSTGLWGKGKQAVRVNGIEWLRRRLIKEGVEVMRRYDSMLPVDPRKSKVRDEKNTGYISESPPPTALPARVSALKIKEIDRRKSLPAPQPSAPQSSRKRRQSEGATEATTRPMRKPRQAHAQEHTITVHTEDEISDTDSEPLSDPPSESDGEGGQIVAASPSPTERSVSSAPDPVAIRQGTRTSTRTQLPRKRPSPERRSSRNRVSAAVPPLPMPPAPTFEADQAVSTSSEGTWTNDLDVKLTDTPDIGTYHIQRQVQDQVTLDEQLEMETVEAAVVI